MCGPRLSTVVHCWKKVFRLWFSRADDGSCSATSEKAVIKDSCVFSFPSVTSNGSKVKNLRTTHAVPTHALQHSELGASDAFALFGYCTCNDSHKFSSWMRLRLEEHANIQVSHFGSINLSVHLSSVHILLYTQ